MEDQIIDQFIEWNVTLQCQVKKRKKKHKQLTFGNFVAKEV